MPEGNDNQQAPAGDPPADAPPTFDSWLEGQDDSVRGLISEHTHGLKSALESERDQRKAFEKQLRDAAAKVEAGSEARQRLDELSVQLDAQGRQADFYETAHAAGVTNLRLAWLAAQADEMQDRRGQVDMDKLKGAYPELFGATTRAPAGNAGAGTQQPPKAAQGMNEFIRRSSGRG